jgi:hypothetical protein
MGTKMIVYDTEVYPNCFLLCALDTESRTRWAFEISSRRNDISVLALWLVNMCAGGQRMVGFNNVGFDYPVLHFIIEGHISDPRMIYDHAMSIINSDDKFRHLIKPSIYRVPQIDLFKIHHFDNVARMTSLKALEFNMRMDNISDLPFPVGTYLTPTQMIELVAYCWNDVDATEQFYLKSVKQIEFRDSLTLKHGQDFTNFNDVKIGKKIFEIALEKQGVSCYDYHPDTGRVPRQTPRSVIRLADCVPTAVAFNNPEFDRIKWHYLNTIITETKGAFSGLSAKVDGLDFVFGTGGIHASVENRKFVADDDWMIYDVDVTSLYPSLAIENGFYPEHLGPKFVEVYRDLRAQRLQHKKGTVENDMLKLALNGVYGASNDKFSVFYDPLFTMRITISGQLWIADLIDNLMLVDSMRIIQANTDGVTMMVRRQSKPELDDMLDNWERNSRLSLERVEYKHMWIADVNSYIAEKMDGSVKRKGRYEYDIGWHQNASSLVIPKVAEQVLLHGANIEQLVSEWNDWQDFYMRAKVPRSSHLLLRYPTFDVPMENTQRYYVSVGGGELVKVMPPLAKKPDHWREIGICKGWTVCPCNNLKDVVLPVNYDYYINEVKKLTEVFNA